MGSWLSKLMKLRRNSIEMIPIFNQAEFRATYRYQNFALPDSIMFYMAKNPRSSKVYQKIVKSCKYFFIKNPILVIHQLNCNSIYQVHESVNRTKLCFIGITSKIWISQNFQNFVSDFVLDILPYEPLHFISFYQSDAKRYQLIGQRVSAINFFQSFASKCEEILLCNSTIKNDNGSILSIQAIISALPKLKIFRCVHSSKMINYKTVEELLCIPHFYSLQYFHLTNIPDTFDIGLFYEYIKINKKTKIYLHYSNQISQGYKYRLQMIAKDIIKRTKSQHSFKVPMI
uniref:Uncharacterized protein n=1 Tax=Panagrolaimus davidi TaxID=227884 RepID=A0A914P520_9BILA